MMNYAVLLFLFVVGRTVCSNGAATTTTTTTTTNYDDAPAGRQCGTVDDSTMEDRARLNGAVGDYLAAHPRDAERTITIDVYWHVLISCAGVGDYDDAAVTRSIQILNDAFGGVESSYPECAAAGRNSSTTTTTATAFTYTDAPATPFVFRLRGITRVLDDGAYDLDRGSSSTYRQQARVGTCSDLNIFTGKSQYLGFAYFPDRCGTNKAQDSVVLNTATLPGVGTAPYDEGDTATHEVGHWLGLYHTFEGGCSGGGDEVTDTAPERQAVFGCPVGRDTCPGNGVDPIHNFMDYTYDCCMFTFTLGQIDRMVSLAGTYRGLDYDRVGDNQQLGFTNEVVHVYKCTEGDKDDDDDDDDDDEDYDYDDKGDDDDEDYDYDYDDKGDDDYNDDDYNDDDYNDDDYNDDCDYLLGIPGIPNDTSSYLKKLILQYQIRRTVSS